MSRHTPGPWRVWESGADSWEICETPSPDRHSHFATVRVGNMWGEEGRANARLIVAAPELYAALERLLRWVEPIAGDNCDKAAEAEEIASVKQAHAALAKAAGADA